LALNRTIIQGFCFALVFSLLLPQFSNKLNPTTVIKNAPIQYTPNWPRIALIVEENVWTQIPDAIIKFELLLNTRFYQVTRVVQPWSNVTELRTYLQNLYDDSIGLEGAILVGDLPVCEYVIPGHPVHLIDQTIPQFLMDLYLMDLDGEFFDTDLDGYLNTHSDPDGTGPADTTPEIWVSRIVPPYPPENWSRNRMGLLSDYFDRLWAYENETFSLTDSSLIFLDNDWMGMTTGIMSDMAVLFNSSQITAVDGYHDTTKERWLSEVIQNYMHGLIWCHAGGTCFSQKFYEPDADNADYLWYSELRQHTVNIPVLVLDTCKVTNFTHPDCQSSWYLFSPGRVVTVMGASRDGGMYFYSEYFKQLAGGQGIGNAFLAWFQLAVGQTFPSWYNQDWWRGMILVGDPTFSISEGLTVSGPLIEWVEEGIHFKTAVQHPNQGFLTSCDRAMYQVCHAYNSCAAGLMGDLPFTNGEWQTILSYDQLTNLEPGTYTIVCRFENEGQIGTSEASQEFLITHTIPQQNRLPPSLALGVAAIIICIVVVFIVILIRRRQ
jgi:hypothetical protein